MIIPKVIRVQETQIKMCGYSDLELKCDTFSTNPDAMSMSNHEMSHTDVT